MFSWLSFGAYRLPEPQVVLQLFDKVQAVLVSYFPQLVGETIC